MNLIPPPHDLAAVLAPADPVTFLRTAWGEQFVRVPGVDGKFTGLLPWQALNGILEQHRLEPPRLRLTRSGQPVPAESFLSFQGSRRSGRRIPRLDAAALTRELREGATLVLDAVDELYAPVTLLAESLERTFRVRVQVNAYAGWRTSHGFDIHWDDHDVLILQVAGRKHWKVYGETRRYPLARDIERATEPPSHALWEGLLEDGDLLYIPRGWWHVATPLDEPTLHLTVGVNSPTGADFLSWFADRLRSAEIVRRDIPHLKGGESRAAFNEALRKTVVEMWDDGLIEQYLTELDASACPRPHCALPWTASEQILPPDAFVVQWNAPRPGHLHVEDGVITIEALGRRWRFAGQSRGLLELLLTGREVSYDELCAAASGAISPDAVRAFVRELVREGLAVLSADV